MKIRMKISAFLLVLFLFSLQTFSDESTCAVCHEDQVAGFNKNAHGKIWASKGVAQENCTKCHGDTSKHLLEKPKTSSSILSFAKKSKNDPKEQNASCLTCHSATSKVAAWKMSKHASNGVSCASCHKIHNGQMGAKPTSQDCLSCHKDVKQELGKFSHHPVIEGKVSCMDCHNPHGTMSGKKALVADSNNQLCYKCHADKRGPHIWEHSPVQENCLTCHVAHGGRYKKLLVEKGHELCQKCHVSVHSIYSGSNGFDKAFSSSTGRVVARDCLNCHTAIHGSSAPSGSGVRAKMFMR